MVKTDKLRGIMAEKKVTGEELAKELGIVPKTFYSKMKAGKFNTDEMQIMVDVLGITNPIEIFLSK